MNQSPTFPFYNSYKRLNSTIFFTLALFCLRIFYKVKNIIDSLQCRNYMILFNYTQLQCYYISSLKQYKASSTFNNLPIFQIFSLCTRSHFRKDNHRLLSELQKTVISTPDMGHSFSFNLQWTWKNSQVHIIGENKK